MSSFLFFLRVLWCGCFVHAYAKLAIQSFSPLTFTVCVQDYTTDAVHYLATLLWVVANSVWAFVSVFLIK
jgi:hypothetical protein